jgi:hypothetical protein
MHANKIRARIEFNVALDWPRDGSILEERVLGIFYDPNQDAKIALTGVPSFIYLLYFYPYIVYDEFI